MDLIATRVYLDEDDNLKKAQLGMYIGDISTFEEDCSNIFISIPGKKTIIKNYLGETFFVLVSFEEVNKKRQEFFKAQAKGQMFNNN